MSRETEALTLYVEGGVAVLVLNVPGQSQNTMKADFLPDVERILDQLERSPGLTGLVVISSKVDSFLAGGDIELFQSLGSREEVVALARRGHSALERLRALPFPTVAAIQGACLGGGLELALACTARVCVDDPKTVLGLPEIQLGLIPAGGGTQHLPTQVGLPAALDLLLTGKQLRPGRAWELGLIDKVVPTAEELRPAAGKLLAERLAPGARAQVWRRGRPLPWTERLSRWVMSGPLRGQVVSRARKAAQARAHGNYPAIDALLDVVLAGGGGLPAGLEAEAQGFARVVSTPEARELMQLFFATSQLKKEHAAGADGAALPLTRVGVLGAGLMGSGIAVVTADKAKLPAVLKDRDEASTQRGVEQARAHFTARAARGSLPQEVANQRAALIQGTTRYADLRGCEIVVEAVFEDLALKHQVLAEVEAAAPEAIFASNTSSIPITHIAAAARRPERVVGMHYFSPVEKMPLLEIITTPQTSPEVVAACARLGLAQGKTVIVVRDGVGFYTSRALGPYMNEAGHLVAQGVPIDVIDRALVKWGFPVGPLTLLDEVGIDVAEKVGHIMLGAFGDRLDPPDAVARLTKGGRKGRKNGRGFYLYGEGKKGKKEVDTTVYAELGVQPSTHLPPEEIATRCALALVNEAARCLEEGILRSPRDGDIGAIFGLGFPPFRGGPFRYVDARGAKEIVAELRRLEAQFGRRFTPAGLLVEMARSGERFYREEGRRGSL